MSVLFTGTRSIAAGTAESLPFAVPQGTKQPGIPLTLRLALDAATFPNGTVTISVSISIDGGANYRTASMTCETPATFRGPAPHFWFMDYSLGPNDNPTHAKFATNSPGAFSTGVTLSTV